MFLAVHLSQRFLQRNTLHQTFLGKHCVKAQLEDEILRTKAVITRGGVKLL